MNKIKILGISGSLRRESYNTALLRAAAKLLPAEAELEILTLEKLPFYNQDLEYTNIPAIIEFKEKIKNADAILFSSPEYNYTIPGVLKNAIDIASRPWGENSFAGKPAAIMGASMGASGAAKAQYHLRQSMVWLDMYPLNKPEFMLGTAQDKINEKGEITDEKTNEKIAELLVALVDWTRKIQQIS
jgi:chromate reductase